MIRISRPCYDKLHRCPGWAGGGMKHAKVQRCEGGSLAGFGGVYYKADGTLRGKRWRLWRLNRCPRCRVVILPYMVRWLEPSWWRWSAARRIGNWKYDREMRRP